MRITLLRHGKPDLSSSSKITAAEVGHWVDLYNCAPLDLELTPSSKVSQLAKNSQFIVCSDLSRSIESANQLGVKKIDCINEIFREFELPYAHFSFLKLAPDSWIIVFRILWFCGFSSNSETFPAAKLRVLTCTTKLIQSAEANDSVLFVGHGFMNRFIAKKLVSFGWKQTIKSGNGFWGISVFEYT